MSPDPRFFKGIALFNNEDFFEAHEVWEELWHETQGAARDFIQGMIQVTSAMHHLQIGNMRGARILHGSGLELLAKYGEAFWGVDLNLVRAEFNRALEEILEGPIERLAGRSQPDLFKIPYSSARSFKIDVHG
ncbi:MAG: DUF309 domain-containing protein [Elusimicrobia bacterium]|nr:DUF309 domain-containing protein [Elusimicrobiota bacterium]